VFTQNTDTLHLESGLSEDVLIHAHGTTGKAHCAVCKAYDSFSELNKALVKGEVRYCKPCSQQGKKSPIKPSVVFFGESLPDEFKLQAQKKALENVDLLLIMGTTLKVQPFSHISKLVPQHAPQVLINRSNEDVASGDTYTESGDHGRLFLKGDCDDVVKRIVEAAEWEEDLLEILPQRHSDFVK